MEGDALMKWEDAMRQATERAAINGRRYRVFGWYWPGQGWIYDFTPIRWREMH